jgi:ATP-dependent DNA helicase RecQ
VEIRPPSDALLLRRFGISALRAPQLAAFDALRAGRDVLVVMPTGGGKSLCYQFPAAAGLAPTIVVSPLIALMKDQVDALGRKGIAAAQLTSALSATARDDAWRRLADGSLALLYVAPEGLESEATMRRIAAASPRLFAVDEAHCISEWGESFRPAYLKLGDARRAMGGPPTIALTATATPRTRREIVARLALHDPERIVAGFDRPNLHFAVEQVVDDVRRNERLVELVRRSPGDVVTYAITRREAERLAAILRRAGISARGYHAGLPPAERATVQDDFLAGRLRAIAATCAFGMGVDKPDVRAVIHTTLPLSLEAYYQEAGRAGRDGTPGRCTLLVAPGDAGRTRGRLAVEPPSLVLIREAERLCRSAGHGRAPSAGELSRALAASPPLVTFALRVLSDAGALVASRDPALTVRLVATRARIERELDPCDGARHWLLGRIDRLGEAAWDHAPLHPDDGRALGAPGARRKRLEELQAGQFLVCGGGEDELRPAAPVADAHLRRCLDREVDRRRREAWRFEMVCGFAAPGRCRRRAILRYFGETPPDGRCSGCDVCDAAPVGA